MQSEKKDLDYSKYLAIDLGVDNFATCVDTIGTAFIIEGRWLKSFNRWWNKEKAKLQSQYDRQGIKFGKKMALLLRKRKNVMNNFMNQAVNYIIKYCLENKIGNIV
ncbi:transposase, partial [Thermococcus sp.]|uniref:transposase n=1 Tax=Thermococcus sp. TaxID=35749 RepID=UPI00257AA4BE